jgi:hypothetical protein
MGGSIAPLQACEERGEAMKQSRWEEGLRDEKDVISIAKMMQYLGFEHRDPLTVGAKKALDQLMMTKNNELMDEVVLDYLMRRLINTPR